MYPFVPFRIPRRIWLLILRFEYTDNLSFAIPGKITPRTALGNHLWMHALLNGHPHTLYYIIELQFRHPTNIDMGGEGLRRRRSYAIRSLEYRVMNLQLLLCFRLPLHPINFELRRYL